MIKQPSTLTLGIVALIVVLGALAFLALGPFKNQVSQRIARIEAALETDPAQWKVYRNDKYGFEFKYPSFLSLEISSNLGTLIHLRLIDRRYDDGYYQDFSNGGGDIGITVLTPPPLDPKTKKQLDSYYEQSIRPMQEQHVNNEELLLNSGARIVFNIYLDLTRVGQFFGRSQDGTSQIFYKVAPQMIEGEIPGGPAGEIAIIGCEYPNKAGITIETAKAGYLEVFNSVIRTFEWMPTR